MSAYWSEPCFFEDTKGYQGIVFTLGIGISLLFSCFVYYFFIAQKMGKNQKEASEHASKSLEAAYDLNHLYKIPQFDDGTRRALQGYRGMLLSVMKKGIGNILACITKA